MRQTYVLGGRRGTTGIRVAACMLAALVFGLAGNAGGAVTRASHPFSTSSTVAFPETDVSFSFHATDSYVGQRYALVGSGRMEFFQQLTEGTKLQAKGGNNTSTVKIVRGGSSATFKTRRLGYRYEFSYSGSHLRQEVVLIGDITRSSIRSINPGDSAEVTLRTDESTPATDLVDITGLNLGVQQIRHQGAQVAIVPKPRPSSMPSRLTLRVNTLQAVATSTSPSVHETAAEVAAKSSLNIRATLDHPLPPGWTMTVWHNGDPESKGNGDYYTLCKITGTTTDTTAPVCAESRPTLPTAGDDFVNASVGAPTYTALYIQIYVPVH